MDADQIIVLDNGRIVGLDTHKNLLKTCEVYREIVSSQLSATEIEESIWVRHRKIDDQDEEWWVGVVLGWVDRGEKLKILVVLLNG